MHPKKARRGVAFGAAGSFVGRRRERLQLSRLDRSAFARPSARQPATRWARRTFNNLGVDLSWVRPRVWEPQPAMVWAGLAIDRLITWSLEISNVAPLRGLMWNAMPLSAI